MVPSDLAVIVRSASWFYRFTVVVVASLLIFLGQAGCAPAIPAPRGTSEEVVVAVPAGSAAEALASAAKQYTASRGAPVRVEVIAGDSYYDRTSAALLAGLDTYDLLYLPADSLPRWVEYHALRPITAGFEREPLEAWLPSLTSPNSENSQNSPLFALPAQPDPLVLWYRADWQQAAGLPDPSRSLEAFRANAQALTVPPGRYGVAVAGGEQDAGMDYAALLAGSLPAVDSPDGLLTAFTGADEQVAARQTLAVYASLFQDGITAPGSEQFSRADVINALRDGQAAMGFAPISAAAELLDCSASPNACADGRPLLAAASLPGGAGCAVLDNLMVWAVPQRAANPVGAERFAAWLVSTEGARAWAAGGGLPANTAVLQNLPEPTGPAARLPDGLVPVLGDAACYRQAFPYTQPSDLFWKALHTTAHSVAAGASSGGSTGGIAPEAAFERAAAEIRQGMRQAGMVH